MFFCVRLGASPARYASVTRLPCGQPYGNFSVHVSTQWRRAPSPSCYCYGAVAWSVTQLVCRNYCSLRVRACGCSPRSCQPICAVLTPPPPFTPSWQVTDDLAELKEVDRGSVYEAGQELANAAVRVLAQGLTMPDREVYGHVVAGRGGDSGAGVCCCC